MKRTDTLKSLEIVLESFLDRAVGLKANRLSVIDGINRLDDLARDSLTDSESDQVMIDRVGGWLARHSSWLDSDQLRLGDRDRLSKVMGSLHVGLARNDDQSPAGQKITAEIDRWRSKLTSTSPSQDQSPKRSGRKLVLRKGPETLPETGQHPSGEDSIGLFAETLKTASDKFREMSHDRLHLMSVLQDALKTATIYPDREALLLSAMIIYYLRQNGYKVEPFVKRLKEAERLQKGTGSHA